MRKILILSLFFVLMTGCKQKNVSTSVYDFDVSVSRVESHKVWLDLFPKNECLPYVLDYMSEEDWQQYGSDRAYLDYLSSLSTEDLHIRQGAFLDALAVRPETSYYLLIAGIKDNKAAELRKERFVSKKENIIHFTIDVDSIRLSADGMLRLSPADTVNTYFWDINLKKYIDKEWNSLHSMWFYYDVDCYYQMDFLVPENGALSKGVEQYNMFEYFTEEDIHMGDTLCLMVVGYDASGETSPAYMPYWIVYRGKESASTVMEAEKDGYENWYMSVSESISPRHSTAKAPWWSQTGCLTPSSVHTDKYIPQHIRSRKR